MLYNLREIHHPTTVEEAVALLRRQDVRTVAMAGGTSLVGEGGPEIEAVIDLDGLGLDEIERQGDTVWNGDVVLMYIPLQAWEAQRARVEELKNYMDGAYSSDFFQQAQDSGVPSFQDDTNRGVREYMT